MSEHILNFAIELDDEGIRKSIHNIAERKIVNDIEMAVLNEIFESASWQKGACAVAANGDVELYNSARLKEWARAIITTAVTNNHKDEIIDRAAAKIADGYLKSKAFKEKVGEFDFDLSERLARIEDDIRRLENAISVLNGIVIH